MRTPRLELRPDDDTGLAALADRAIDGVHPADEMPFLEPWTDDAGDPGFARGIMQYAWRCRAEIGPTRWSVNFLVRDAGRVIGMQTLAATDFAVLGEVRSGSWLTRSMQGRGLGTEMRHAVIGLALRPPRRPRGPDECLRRQRRLPAGVGTPRLRARRRRAPRPARPRGGAAAQPADAGDVAAPRLDRRGRRPRAVPGAAGGADHAVTMADRRPGLGCRSGSIQEGGVNHGRPSIMLIVQCPWWITWW